MIVFARVVLLPLVLVMATVAGLGSYYETSDDTTLAWLFSGVLAQPPVSALPLYFHGYGHGLAAAYVAWPGVPWVGNKVYLWVAKNRFKLVPCKDGVCSLPTNPSRK